MLVTESGCWSPVVVFKILRQYLKSVTNINALHVMVNVPERLFNSLKAVDHELLDSDLSDLQDEELEDYFKLSNLCLVTNKGHTYGPYGSTDLLGREPVTICINNGNVLAQATCNFTYPGEGDKPIDFTNRKCFSFYVSFIYKGNGVHFYFKKSAKNQ